MSKIRQLCHKRTKGLDSWNIGGLKEVGERKVDAGSQRKHRKLQKEYKSYHFLDLPPSNLNKDTMHSPGTNSPYVRED